MRTLVTGVSGFAGAELARSLSALGHDVRTLARDPSRVTLELDVVPGDALTGEGLATAMRDVEVAYYLIHSMESTSPGALGFSQRERTAAENFAAAARVAGVRRIVYLGGLLGRPDPHPLSRHLDSRAAVEAILREAVPDSVNLRASIVIGARSRSFRLLVRLVERMPILTLPPWRSFRTQPIDARDLIQMLLAAARAPVGGRSLDIAGPDVLTYGEIVGRIAELMLVRRPSLGLAVSASPLTARVVAAVAGEDPELVVPLMESLNRDLLPSFDGAAELLNVRLHSFDAAVEHALGEWERSEPLAAR